MGDSAPLVRPRQMPDCRIQNIPESSQNQFQTVDRGEHNRSRHRSTVLERLKDFVVTPAERPGIVIAGGRDHAQQD